MATKKEIADITREIEEHRTTNPNKANGLILALAILMDEHEPEYILTVNQADEPSGSFSCALRDMFNGQSVRLKGWSRGDHLKFTKQRFYYVTALRGREVLNELPLNWLTLDHWERCDESS